MCVCVSKSITIRSVSLVISQLIHQLLFVVKCLAFGDRPCGIAGSPKRGRKNGERLAGMPWKAKKKAFGIQVGWKIPVYLFMSSHLQFTYEIQVGWISKIIKKILNPSPVYLFILFELQRDLDRPPQKILKRTPFHGGWNVEKAVIFITPHNP